MSAAVSQMDISNSKRAPEIGTTNLNEVGDSIYIDDESENGYSHETVNHSNSYNNDEYSLNSNTNLSSTSNMAYGTLNSLTSEVIIIL